MENEDISHECDYYTYDRHIFNETGYLEEVLDYLYNKYCTLSFKFYLFILFFSIVIHYLFFILCVFDFSLPSLLPLFFIIFIFFLILKYFPGRTLPEEYRKPKYFFLAFKYIHRYPHKTDQDVLRCGLQLYIRKYCPLSITWH